MCLCSGWYVDAGPELERDLRLMGAADRACSVHHGTNYLLEVSENQQPHI